MRGFIDYTTYRVVENEENKDKKNKEGKKAYILLLGRLENNKTFATINKFEPYFFVEEKHKETVKEQLKSLELRGRTEKTGLKSWEGKPVIKIILKSPKQVPLLRKELESQEIDCYEADIRFTQRFLIDKKIQGVVEIKTNSEQKRGGSELKKELAQLQEHLQEQLQEQLRVDEFFVEPELKAVKIEELGDYWPELKLLSLDIETSKRGEVISVALVYGKMGKERGGWQEEVYTVKKNAEDETDLLVKTRDRIIEINPDIIVGWNVIDFDFRVLRERLAAKKVPFDWGRKEKEKVRMRVYNDFLRDSTIDIFGRVVLDGINLLRISFISLEDYKLETAAQTFLDEGKYIKQDEKDAEGGLDEIWKKNPEKIAEYNLQDARLVLKIIEKTGVLGLTITRSMLTGMMLDEVKKTVASFDSLYLKELRKRGRVAYSSFRTRKTEQLSGGYVMSSKPGFYQNVLVLDFKSLYPSLVMTFNIDPLTYLGLTKIQDLKKLEKKKQSYVVAPNKAVFENNQGILPSIIARLFKQREKARKEKDELKRYAIKTLMNSFYGALANEACRFFNLYVANAITSFGRELVKLSAKKLEEWGYEVIYGDTDSIFLNTKLKDEKRAKEVGKKLEKEMNKFFENYIKEKYARKNQLEIEFDKHYAKFFMPTMRGVKAGSKKRYAGLVREKEEEEKIIFIGLESVRRDWTEAAKKLQQELLKRIFHNMDIDDYLRRFVDKVKKGEMDELLIYRKALRKSPEEYVKTTPPHVKAARKLSKLTTNLIEYYQTINGPEPVEKKESSIDYQHYVDKQLKPVANTILKPINKDFDEILKGKQKSLFDF